MLLLAGWAFSAVWRPCRQGWLPSLNAERWQQSTHAWGVCLGHDSCESWHPSEVLVLRTCEWRLWKVFKPKLNIFRLLMWLRIQFVTSANLPANMFTFLFSCPSQGGEEAEPWVWAPDTPGLCGTWARMSHRTHNCGVREQPTGRALATCWGPAEKASYQRAGCCVFYFVFIDYYINIKYYL